MKYSYIILIFFAFACTKENLEDSGTVIVDGTPYEILSSSCQTGLTSGNYRECGWQTRFLMDGQEVVLNAAATNVDCNAMSQGENYTWSISLFSSGSLDFNYRYRGTEPVDWSSSSFGFGEVVMEDNLNGATIVVSTRGLILCAE